MQILNTLNLSLVQITVFYIPLYHGSTAVSTLTDINEIVLNKQHKTPKALDHGNHLHCYNCNTMEHGDSCINHNNQSFRRFEYKCTGEFKICVTQWYSYTTSTENSTSAVNLWLLKRNCAKKCEPGCIVMGERTKIYACTQCCATNFCNVGKGGALSDHNIGPLHQLYVLLLYAVVSLLSPSDIGGLWSWLL